MITFSSSDRVFVLTGAGVSAESGIPTFRGVGGLWRDYRIEEVASPEAWRHDPQLVWEFYSMRRRVASAAKPNPAHFSRAAATPAAALHLTTRISTNRQPKFPGVNAAAGFARTSAGLAKCRLNWIGSIAPWIYALSLWP